MGHWKTIYIEFIKCNGAVSRHGHTAAPVSHIGTARPQRVIKHSSNYPKHILATGGTSHAIHRSTTWTRSPAIKSKTSSSLGLNFQGVWGKVEGTN